MANEKVNKLGDPDVHAMKNGYYVRLRKALENLSKLAFRKSTINNMILSFIPHLKRTDRDVGGLPFYSKQYTSTKTTKDHALLCVISMLVQVYWDINAGVIPVPEGDEADVLDEFEVNLALLEGIVKSGTDAYRIHGKFPDYQLLTRIEIVAREEEIGLNAEEEIRCANAAAAGSHAEEDQLNKAAGLKPKHGRPGSIEEDSKEAKKLMAKALGSSSDTLDSTTEALDSSDSASQDSPSTQSTQAADGAAETDAADASISVGSVAGGIVISQGQSGGVTLSSDQLSVEEADACGGDCDNCENHACEDDERGLEDDVDEMQEDHDLQPALGIGADLGQAEINAKEDSEAGGANDSEPYPDAEPLEQTIKDAQAKDATPPMPDEEAEEQAAVDHETGADQVDGDGQPNPTAEELNEGNADGSKNFKA